MSSTSPNGGAEWVHPNSLRVLPHRSPAKPSKQFQKGLDMVFSGAGPAAAAVLTNPFDVAKVRMQLQGEVSSGGAKAYNGSFDCIFKTFKEEGAAGIQRGLTASIIREGSKNFFRIGLFHPVLDYLHTDEQTSAPVWKRLIAGSISGASGAIICNPIEIAKTRLQASSIAGSTVGYQGYKYNGLTDALKVISRDEGVKALWVGTAISTVRSILATSANMTVNSIAKESLVQDPRLSFLGLTTGVLTDGIASMLSAFAAVAANNPADVVRTRLYNQPFKIVDGVRVGEYYSGMGQCAGAIFKTEGLLAFWKGFTGHFMRTGPHYIVSFILIGYMQRASRNVIDKRGSSAWDQSMLASFARFNAEDNSGWGAKEVAAALKEACHERVPTGTDAKELQRAAALEMRFKLEATAILRESGVAPSGRMSFDTFRTRGAPALDAAVARIFATTSSSPAAAAR